MTDGPYTTLTVASYNEICWTLKALRKRLQDIRELLEKNKVKEALEILKVEA